MPKKKSACVSSANPTRAPNHPASTSTSGGTARQAAWITGVAKHKKTEAKRSPWEIESARASRGKRSVENRKIN
jgi:hypothetical protein